MKNISHKKWIDDYSEAVKNFTFGDHDETSHLPFNAFSFYPLYFDLWLDKIYLAIIQLEERGVGDIKIHRSLPDYACLKYIFYTLVNMAAYYNYDDKKAIKIFDFFIKNMSSLTNYGNLFNEKSNLIKTEAEINEIIQNLTETDDAQRKLIARLSGSLAMYSHALYNDYSTEFGYNIEGPYRIGDKVLLIKNYPDLKPTKLWKELEETELKNIKIYGLYGDKNIKMRFVSTHILAKENYQKTLEKHLVFLNGKVVNDLDELKNATEEIALNASKIYLKTKSLSFENVKLKFLEQQAYELKDFMILSRLDWKPDKSFKLAIKNKKLVEEFIKLPYPKNQREYEDYIGVSYLKRIYDKK